MLSFYYLRSLPAERQHATGLHKPSTSVAVSAGGSKSGNAASSAVQAGAC